MKHYFLSSYRKSLFHTHTHTHRHRSCGNKSRFDAIRLIVVVFLMIMSASSCKKVDYEVAESKEYSTFFNLKGKLSAQEQRVIDYTKGKLSPDFIKRFINEAGYPIWDKTIQTLQKKKGGVTSFGNSTASLSNLDTLIYIPLVLPDSSVVNGYILATLDDSVGLSYSLSRDYKYYPEVANECYRC